MKKTLIIIAILAALLIIPVSAANVGDKISEAVYTDIVAYINNYPMPAYVIDGYAVIVAEDLRDYCCDVVYDEATRSLYITKAGEDATFSNKLVYKPNRETGEFYTDVLYTDIKTYVNGNEVKSFNVNGKTMISIDEFGKNMDGYTWDSVNRAALALIDGKDVTKFKPVEKRIEKLGKDILKFEENWEKCIKTWTGAYDFDFDGIPEEIFVEIKDTDGVRKGLDSDDSFVKVSVGGKTVEFRSYITGLRHIAVCDLNLNDGTKDLGIMFRTDTSAVYCFYKYGETLQSYKFGKNTSIGSRLYYDYELENDELKIKMDSDTGYMWPIDVTYVKSDTDDLLFVKKGVPYYEIPKSYMGDTPRVSDIGREIDAVEKEMWKKGYIKARCDGDYIGENIIIKSGEYFKVMYDSGNGYVFIEKLSGESGWIYVRHSVNGNWLNDSFFYIPIY